MTETIIGSAVLAVVGGIVGALIGTDAPDRAAAAISGLWTRAMRLFSAPGSSSMLAGAAIIATLSIGIGLADETSFREVLSRPGAGWLFRLQFWFGTMLLAGGFAHWWVQTRKRIRGEQHPQ